MYKVGQRILINSCSGNTKCMDCNLSCSHKIPGKEWYTARITNVHECGNITTDNDITAHPGNHIKLLLDYVERMTSV